MYESLCDSKKHQLVTCARSCIGQSLWKRNAELIDAPAIVNCYRFVQWLWLPYGRELPDHLLVWDGAGEVPLSGATAADLIFIARKHRTAQTDDFGHVGVLTFEGTVVHATRWENGVVETPLQTFLSRECLGIRRIKPQLPP